MRFLSTAFPILILHERREMLSSLEKNWFFWLFIQKSLRLLLPLSLQEEGITIFLRFLTRSWIYQLKRSPPFIFSQFSLKIFGFGEMNDDSQFRIQEFTYMEQLFPPLFRVIRSVLGMGISKDFWMIAVLIKSKHIPVKSLSIIFAVHRHFNLNWITKNSLWVWLPLTVSFGRAGNDSPPRPNI